MINYCSGLKNLTIYSIAFTYNICSLSSIVIHALHFRFHSVRSERNSCFMKVTLTELQYAECIRILSTNL